MAFSLQISVRDARRCPDVQGVLIDAWDTLETSLIFIESVSEKEREVKVRPSKQRQTDICVFRTGDDVPDHSGPGGVRWQYFSEAGYIAGDSLRGGEDKYARNKFNQVSECNVCPEERESLLISENTNHLDNRRLCHDRRPVTRSES